MAADGGTILALDVGSVRIGLAMASSIARIARPFGVLTHDGTVTERLRALCKEEGVTHIVIGLPRGLDGQETAQTAVVRAFGEHTAAQLGLPCHWQDEAATSLQATRELGARGKPYTKQDVDALAAAIILEDYLHGNL